MQPIPDTHHSMILTFGNITLLGFGFLAKWIQNWLRHQQKAVELNDSEKRKWCYDMNICIIQYFLQKEERCALNVGDPPDV